MNNAKKTQKKTFHLSEKGSQSIKSLAEAESRTQSAVLERMIEFYLTHKGSKPERSAIDSLGGLHHER